MTPVQLLKPKTSEWPEDAVRAVKALRERVEELEERERQAEQAPPDTECVLMEHRAQKHFGVSGGAQARILVALARQSLLTREGVRATMYRDRPSDPDTCCNIEVVQIAKVRKHLRAHGITIETIWQTGYRFSDEDRARVMAILKGAET